MDRHAHTPPSGDRTGDADPPSRAARQEETRRALVLAARAVFTRDGYHAATLAQIAREAGFSKGAVYSNFANKAELFLAVMELHLAVYRGGAWDPFGEPSEGDEDEASKLPLDLPPDQLPDPPPQLPEDVRAWEEAALRGFGLASLEFLAAAMRDPELSGQVTEHVQQVLASYTAVAGRARPEGEALDARDVGTLLAALDEGISLLGLLGITSVDAPLLRTGLRRLVDPARAAADPAPPSEREGRPAYVHPELRERLFADIEPDDPPDPA